MSADSLVVEAVVQLARKRKAMDIPQAARLRVLLHEAGIVDLASARAALQRLAPSIGAAEVGQVVQYLAKPEQQTFGAYRPFAHLADGGMGSVWLAADPTGSHLVVVKTLKAGMQNDAELKRRFEREVRIMMDFRHASVVRCLDSGQAADGTLFMVLEFVEHGDLQELVDRTGGLPEAIALAILHQVADGLSEAQRRQLVHRDIKPANIFASFLGVAKLADFGIARSTADTRTMLTMQGVLVGSPYYMSPEQIVGDADLDIRTDLYALGCVLYFSLTGVEPYRGKLQEVLHAHRTAPIPDVRSLRPQISTATARIISTCMSKPRGDRYQGPAELRAALADACLAVEAPALAKAHSAAAAGFGSAARTMVADFAALAGAAPSQANDPLAATVASDLSGGTALAAESVSATATATATATAAGATLTLSADAPASDPLAITTGAHVQSESLDGDHTSAMDHPWLALVGPGGRSVLLWARTGLCLGKLREPPVDLALRTYPLVATQANWGTVSRQHARIQYDPVLARAWIGDLGSGNGTTFDGAPLAASTQRALDSDREHRVCFARAVTLALRALPRRRAPLRELAGVAAPLTPPICGIDTDHALDAVVITRPDNRCEHAYALVLRRISIGGPGADIAIPGAATNERTELALMAGRWIWRVGPGDNVWRPLALNTQLSCGGLPFVVRPAGYDDFNAE